MATEVRAMQQAIERRNPEQARIPLEDVLVELRPEGYDEAFEADAVDVGLGGLAMRAAILPDVGSRLCCRFQSPHDGRCVDASAEVVWARDAGPSAGEFGLRFDTLDPDDEASIRGIIEAWHAAMGLDFDEPSDRGVVSLKLEGVGPRLDADVVHRAGDVLVVEQGLPFLRLGKAVEEDGRVGRLESVDLRVEGETPRLVLTIGFDRVRAPSEDVGGDTLMDVASPARDADTPMEPRIVIPDDAEIVARRTRAEEPARRARVEEPVRARAEEPAREARTERAEPEIEAPRVEREAREARAEREHDEAERAGEDAEAEAIARAEARRARRARRDAEAPQIVRTEKRRESAASDEASSEDRAELASSEAVRSENVALVKARSALVAIRAWALMAWAKVAPASRAAWARARHAFGSFARRVGPFARVLAAKVRGRAVMPSTKKATQATASSAPRASRVPRRTTAAPGQRESRVDESAPARPRKKWIALGGVAAIATGSLIALAGGEDAEASASPAEATSSASAPSLPELADPEVGDVGTTAPAVAPGGPMPAPSFPSLRDGARPTAAPGEVPAGSPYAVDVNAAAAPSAAPAPVAGGSATFGTEGTSGDELRMRMDGPVGGLRGERTDDGFRVVVPGVRAIDGARRLAAMNPAIERASILNESEGAVLSVRFVSGQSPSYFVRADGDGLVVTVAR
jgi:hypothetical protein